MDVVKQTMNNGGSQAAVGGGGGWRSCLALHGMAMSPEIRDYYRYLLGEVEVQPGPIVLPDGFTATALAQIIYQTLVKKASLLEDVRHVQILYSAWAILNDAYTPIDADVKATQTDVPVTRACAVRESTTQTAARPTVQNSAAQTPDRPQVRESASQTAAAAPPERAGTRDCAAQTAGRPALRSWAVQTAAVPAAGTDAAAQTAAAASTPAGSQTEPIKRRTKWTQMRRRPVRAAGSQTEPPPPDAPPPSECCAAETQTMVLAYRATETQTLLPGALGGRRTAGTQTVRPRPPWVVCVVRGVRPPPAERTAAPRLFHGRRLLRRGHGDAPPVIPLQVCGSPSAAPADPRVTTGSESGRLRDRTDSDSASIASPTVPGPRRSRSVSSGRDPDLAAPGPGDPGNPGSPADRDRGTRDPAPTAQEEAGSQEVPIALDVEMVSDLDTRRSYLDGPPAELTGASGAAPRTAASAASRPDSGSDMDLDAI